MIKIKLMNYDATEYKVLENDLQNLVKKGYTCKKINYITLFRKDQRSLHYLTDIFDSNASSKFERLDDKEIWMKKYTKKEYTLLGNIKNIHVFQTTNQENIAEDNTEDVLQDFFGKKHLLKKLLFTGLAGLISYFIIPPVFSNISISQYLTNGAILFHYLPLLICLILLFRAISNLFYTVRYKKGVVTSREKLYSHSKVQKKLRSGYMYSIVLSILVFVFSMYLDTFERKDIAINSEVLTLSDFNLKSNHSKDNVIHTRKSFLIPYSYTFIDQYGELEDEENGELLSIRYYEFKDKNSAKPFVDEFKKQSNLEIKDVILNKNKHYTAYLASSSDKKVIDTIILWQEEKLIVIATSFSLNTEEYQTIIISHYLK